MSKESEGDSREREVSEASEPDTRERLTAQEVFDDVARHLLTQKVQSTRLKDPGLPAELYNIACAYRGTGGLKCAVGCLIRDDEYDEVMDYNAASVMTLMRLKLLPERLREHRALLSDLQAAHDALDPDDESTLWPHELACVAEKFELDASVLKEFA